MRMPKWIIFVCISVIALLTILFTSISSIVVIVGMGVSLYLISEVYAKHAFREERRENQELQEKVRSTAKDIHLKNKQLLTVVSNIPFPMLLLDHKGNIVMYNTIDELLQDNGDCHHSMDYEHNDFVHIVQEFVKDSFLLEKKLEKIISIRNIEYQAIGIPISSKTRYSGCLILFQNISKTLEGEKMQRRFLADASHELKTPIAVIKGMVEILNRKDFEDDATRTEFLQQIEVEINRLDLLVKDLLQLSRLSLSQVLLERERTDVRSLIDKACRSLQQDIEEKGLKLVKDYQTEEMAFCDPQKMMQVILNLLSNAIKYTDEGTICIKTFLNNHSFVIMVSDTGVGISNEDIPKIFERFYRINDDRSRKSGGSGLGLPIVKSIVDAHGGKIEVKSVVGKGTDFIIRLKH